MALLRSAGGGGDVIVRVQENRLLVLRKAMQHPFSGRRHVGPVLPQTAVPAAKQMLLCFPDPQQPASLLAEAARRSNAASKLAG
jgi:hypothetical protein